MLKPYELENIINCAIYEALDGQIVDGKCEGPNTISSADVEEDPETHDLILRYKEDITSDETDVYRIKVEFVG